MTLSIQEAEDIIAEVKERDTAIGRDMSRWWMYENRIRAAANISSMIEPRYRLKSYFDKKVGGNIYDLIINKNVYSNKNINGRDY